ncbi:kinesin-like protein KIN-4A isoform X2 [Cucurbita maxima]|uniref:Kinesin-like protein KIN-4A isoform X2 n=2 Tax=Cucurbita maxima TaxID=3661 RepID=A0A6J1IGK3_CUCMA|nr:kinesin-like protein KIN-4A isoform X2 [Cucurbita maxima]
MIRVQDEAEVGAVVAEEGLGVEIGEWNCTQSRLSLTDNNHPQFINTRHPVDCVSEVVKAEMKGFGCTGTSALKQHFEKKVHKLEQEERVLQKETEELRCKFSNILSTS